MTAYCIFIVKFCRGLLSPENMTKISCDLNYAYQGFITPFKLTLFFQLYLIVALRQVLFLVYK